jgi:hypothetical protein
MFKRTGIGYCCLALAYAAYCGSGYCKAGVIDTCDKGKSHDICKDDKDVKHDDCKIEFKLDDKYGKDGKDGKDLCKDLKDSKHDKDCKDLKDRKDLKDCKDDRKLLCVVSWIKDHDHGKCGLDIKGDCNPDPIQDGGCHYIPCDPGCDHGGCASVPAPAASMMGGFGVAGVMLASWLRGRRYGKTA